MSQILLVEPDKQLAETIKKFLTNRGLEILVANEAQQAVNAADQAKPDLIILEIAMPRHNGVAFLQELRSYADWQKLPVLVYSQIAREDTGATEADWQRLGVAAYLYKPTNTLSSLFNNIQEILTNYEKS